MRTIGVATTRSVDRLIEAGAEFVVSTLGDEGVWGIIAGYQERSPGVGGSLLRGE